MADYQYHFYNWSTRQYIDTLPMENTSFTSEIRGAGEFSGEVPIFAEGLSAQRVLDATLAYRTKLFVERGQALVWGGWVHQVPDYDSTTGRLVVNAQESIGYLGSRYLPTLTYMGVEQLDIARGIVSAVQSETGGDMWIVPTANLSGVPRDASYSKYDYTEALGALTELSEVVGGFEFATAVTWDAGQPRENLLLGYPRLGRTGAAAAMVLEFNRFLANPGNVESYTWPGGPGFATRVHASTETDEGVVLAAQADNATALAVGYPLVETSESFDGIVAQAEIEARAAALATATSRPRVAPTFTVRAGPGTELGDFALGDDVLIRLTDFRFPARAGGAPGLAALVRITGLEVTPGPPEVYTFTMSEVLEPL